VSDRVSELRRAAQLGRHYRDQENLTIGEIAQRLGRAPSTVKAYLYDPSDDNKRPTDRPRALMSASALRALRTAPASAQGRPWPQQGTSALLGTVRSSASKRGAHRGRRHD